MVKRIVVSHYVYEPDYCHAYIGIDGVIRFRDKIGEHTDIMQVAYVSRSVDMVTDAQCQAVVTLVLASTLKYGLPDGSVSTVGLSWDELLRRA